MKRSTGLEIVGIPAGRGRVVGLDKIPTESTTLPDKEEPEDTPVNTVHLVDVPYDTPKKLKYLRSIEIYLQAQLTEVQNQIKDLLQKSVQ